MGKDLAIPYVGDEPYLFASYCHKDECIVLPVLRFLQDKVRLWYYSGIDPGARWAEVIDNSLDKSSAFLAFFSQNSLESHDFRKVFNFALMKDLQVLSVILEPMKFTPVMKLQLATVQTIYYYDYEWDEFRCELLNSLTLKPVIIPPAPGKHFFLRRTLTSGQSERVEISHSNFKIGRKADPDLSDFVVEDKNKYVGKVHAIFDITAEGLFIRDNASLNCTYLKKNSSSVVKRLEPGESYPLEAGDHVWMVHKRFKFVVEIEEIGSANS